MVAAAGDEIVAQSVGQLRDFFDAPGFGDEAGDIGTGGDEAALFERFDF